MFRYKSGVKASYNRQGYIYFVSRMYQELGAEDQRKILNLCIEIGGAYYRALFEFVTTDAGVTELTMKHNLGRSTLYRIVQRYYENFPKKL